MTNSSSLRLLPLFRAVLAVGFVAAIASVSSAAGAKSEIRAQAIVSSFEVSILPKPRPTWQRPAPVTWSSRFNVRWEARWSSEGKYMA
jgi:hypothetical protein